MPKWTESAAYPYGIAFVFWMFFSLVENFHPHTCYLIDPIKASISGLLLIRVWTRLPPFGKMRWGESLLVGLAVFGLGILTAPHHERHPVIDEGFNPFDLFGATWITYALYFSHLLGLVVVAPIAEEIFWRGFLMRYLISKDFQSVPLGFCNPASFLVATSFIALSHGAAWAPALTSATLLGLWFIHTRSLGCVMLAHTMANLALGCYVLFSKTWVLW